MPTAGQSHAKTGPLPHLMQGGWLAREPQRNGGRGVLDEHRAGEFSDLHFVLFREGLAALVQNDQSSLGGRERGSVTERGRHKGEEIGGGVFFWLVREVNQEPDPTVLPKAEEITGAAVAAIGDVLMRDAGRGGAN